MVRVIIDGVDYTSGVPLDIEADSIFVDAGTAAAPSVAIGRVNDGFYLVSDGVVGNASGGNLKWKFAGDVFQAANASGGGLINQAASGTAATLLTRHSDLDSGPGSAAADQPCMVAGGVNAVTWIENGGVLVLSQINASITADTGSSQGDGPITSSINIITVCVNAGDAQTMPPAVAGLLVEIYNEGAEAADIFPFTDDDLGAGADTAVSLAVGANITYRAIDAVNWKVRT